MMRIWLLGDTHGDWQWVNYVQYRAKEAGVDLVFQLGDFGIWAGTNGARFLDECSKQAVALDLPLYFLDGNHENFPLLYDMADKAKPNDTGHLEIKPSIYYSPRGHRWVWDGIKFMSMGGAISIDKAYRRHGKSWWPEEEITEAQLNAVSDEKVDVLLTHDCPFNPLSVYDRNSVYDRMSEPNQQRVSRLVDKVRPDWLFHGHFHIFHNREWRGTNVVGLNNEWRDKSEAILELPSMDLEVF